MATVEGAVAEPVLDKPAGATPDSSARPDTAGKPATSQPEPKWEETPQYKGMHADLKKEREARQAHEKAVAAKDAEVAEWRRKVEALTGLKPPSKEQADTDLVKGKLLELYPELAELGSISEMKKALDEQQVQGFAEHSKRIMAQVYQGIAAEYGELTESMKRRINAAYLYDNQTNPEFHARHNQGDPTLIAEFVEGYLKDLVEPIKKKVAAAEVRRFPRVPSGKDRSTPLKGEKPLDPTDPKAGAEMLRNHFRANARG